MMSGVPPTSALHSFLRGVRVLDLSSYVPGPLASLLLADMGADVVKVERPGGDEMQNMGPRGQQGEPVFYNSLNGGKKVVWLDLKNAVDQAAFRKLARETDVVLEGFRPGVTERLGADYQTLKQINPGLIYCSISGYGASGPLALAAGHDGNYLATTGILHRNGGDAPFFFDPPVADGSSSLFAAIAILGALYRRAQDGTGCQIDLGIADVVMPLQVMQVADFGEHGTLRGREETYLNGGAAYYRVYATRDGHHIMLGAIEPKFWVAFCTASGHEEWIARQTEPMRQTALIDEVAGFVATLTLDQCVSRFSSGDCCVSPVLDLGEALGSQQIKHRGLVRESEQGELQALFPAVIDGVAPPTRQPCEHLDRNSLGAAFKPRPSIQSRQSAATIKQAEGEIA